MVFANSEMSYDELMAVFREDLYSRMPVYSETRDNIIGVINLKDIFFYEGKAVFADGFHSEHHVFFLDGLAHMGQVFKSVNNMAGN